MADSASVRDSLRRLDPVLEHRMRLAACVLLSRVDALAFSRLKALLGATDGNLGAQLRRLEIAGYLAVRKEFQDRKPVSWYSLTEEGKAALSAHLTSLDSIIRGNAASGPNGSSVPE